MAGLPEAEAFRKKVLVLYDKYRFPEAETRTPNRHRHELAVTENALRIGKAYGLSDYWMGILWKAGLVHDLGQAAVSDYPVCADLRNFAKEKGVPYRPQMLLEAMRSEGKNVSPGALLDLHEEFFTRIQTAGFDMSRYGKERTRRACRALFSHEVASWQILQEHIRELPLEIEPEVGLVVRHHTYPEMLPAETDPMVRALTEILKSADSMDARNDRARAKVYNRPPDFQESLQDAETYIIGEYRANHISQEVLIALHRVIQSDNGEFRRIIMTARAQPENTSWPAYDVDYRKRSLADILATTPQPAASGARPEYVTLPSTSI